jgi:hypothetical protein
MRANGTSTDELDAWLLKIENVLNGLRSGQQVIVRNGTIDIGKGNRHLYYGDCRWDFEFWFNGGDYLTLKELLPVSIEESTQPTDYSQTDLVWRNTYPITHITATRLNNGEMIADEDYTLEKDIKINIASLNSGDILAVTAVLFNGEIVTKKIFIP